MNKTEQFKKMPGFEKYYVSDFGNVISTQTKKPIFLKPGIDGNGYEVVTLYNKPLKRVMKISTMVAVAFLGHKALNVHTTIVKHKDGNKLNSRLDNLQIIEKEISKQNGVRFSESLGKWRADLNYKSIKKYIGVFETEQQAINAYLDRLNKIKKRLGHE